MYVARVRCRVQWTHPTFRVETCSEKRQSRLTGEVDGGSIRTGVKMWRLTSNFMLH